LADQAERTNSVAAPLINKTLDAFP